MGPVVVGGTGEAGAKAGAFHTDPEVARPFIDCRIDWAGVTLRMRGLAGEVRLRNSPKET